MKLFNLHLSTHSACIVFGVFLLFQTTGCISANMHQTARTLQPGTMETGASAAVIHYEDITEYKFPEGEISKETYTVVVQPEGWIRYGVAERVDMGVRFFPYGVRFDGKIQFLNTPQFASAVDPGFCMGFFDVSGDISESVAILNFDIPLIFSLDITKLSTFYFGPRYIFNHVIQEDDDDTVHYVGGFLGMEFRKGKFGFLPEIAIYYVSNPSDDPHEKEHTGIAIFPSLGFKTSF